MNEEIFINSSWERGGLSVIVIELVLVIVVRVILSTQLNAMLVS